MNDRVRELIGHIDVNAKVRELAEQSGCKIDKLGYGEGNLEKFAELIVRECMQVGLEQKKWVEDQTVFNESDEVWNRARIQQSQHIVDKIKEHFGVE